MMGEATPDYDVINGRSIDLGHLLHDSVDGKTSQIVSSHVDEGAFECATDRCSSSCDDYGFGHCSHPIFELTLKLSPKSYCSFMSQRPGTAGWTSVLALAITVTVGCNPGSGSATVPDRVTTTTIGGPTSTLPPIVECPGAGEFGEGAGIADINGEGFDGSNLGQISWEVTDQCESFTFDFETSEGAPAISVPDMTVGHLDSFQVIRITLDVASTIVTDQLVESGFVDRLYVVRALDGGMFVDMHLNTPAAARARVTSEPARLTVDLRPGFVEFSGSSALDDLVVVVGPSDGASVTPTSSVTGYARTFEANVLLIATQDGQVVTETGTSAADWTETWGEFRQDVTLPPGNVSLFVGESSPQDGSLAGVTLDLAVG